MVGLCHFPKELFEEIMLWVPADSLVRFKCVNKSWYSLISALINDPAFVAKHLLITKNKSSTSIVFYCHAHDDHDGGDSYGSMFPLLTLFKDEGNNNDIVPVIEDLRVPHIRNESESDKCRYLWERLYHFDGIICLVKSSGTIMLCNHALQESRVLPQSKNAINGGTLSGAGFGYDYRANDYKFVTIWFPPTGLTKAEVYTLGTDSWREVNMSQDLCEDIQAICTYGDDGLYVGGVYYWLILDAEDDDMILSFNMCDEKFHIMPCPPEDIPFQAFFYRLSVWNDSFALLLCSRGIESPEYQFFVEVFVMDEGGATGACSWTKHLLTGPLVLPIVDTLPFFHNDEYLLQVMESTDKSLTKRERKMTRKLVSCNIRTQELIDIVVDYDKRGWHWACLYIKSLVSVKGRS